MASIQSIAVYYFDLYNHFYSMKFNTRSIDLFMTLMNDDTNDQSLFERLEYFLTWIYFYYFNAVNSIWNWLQFGFGIIFLKFLPVLESTSADFTALNDLQRKSHDNVLRLEGLPWNSKENDICQFFHGNEYEK